MKKKVRKPAKKPVVKSLGFLTGKMLKSLGACGVGVQKFTNVFGDGTDLTEAACIQAARAGMDLYEFSGFTLSGGRHNQYDEAECKAAREFAVRASPHVTAFAQGCAMDVEMLEFPGEDVEGTLGMVADHTGNINQALTATACRTATARAAYELAMAPEIERLAQERGKALWGILCKASLAGDLELEKENE